jgi:radical SAM-linked protein
MRFSPALPMGVESQCEFVEIELEEGVETQEVSERLARELPPGIQVTSAEPLRARLLDRIAGVVWLVEGLPPAADRQRTVRERLARGPLEVTRRRGKVIDLQQLVEEIQPVDDTACEIHCRFGPGGTVRPRELLTTLLELSEEAAACARVTRARWSLSPESSALLGGD